MSSKILMALDGSPVTRPALDRMERMAKELDSRVILLRVLNNNGSRGRSNPDDCADEWMAAQEYLTRIEANLGARDVEVASVIQDGEDKKVIREVAHQEKVNLIVLRGQTYVDARRQKFCMALVENLKGSNIGVSLIHQ